MIFPKQLKNFMPGAIVKYNNIEVKIIDIFYKNKKKWYAKSEMSIGTYHICILDPNDSEYNQRFTYDIP